MAFFARERTVGLLEQCCHRRGARTVEERAQEVLHRRLLRDAPRDGGVVDVSWPVLLVPEMSLFLENSELCADGSSARRIGELLVNLRRGRVATLVDDIHDLP